MEHEKISVRMHFSGQMSKRNKKFMVLFVRVCCIIRKSACETHKAPQQGIHKKRRENYEEQNSEIVTFVVSVIC